MNELSEEIKNLEFSINDNEEEVDEQQLLAEKKKFRDYIFFFSGQQISLLGSSVVSFVLIWWISETTQSELMLGLASLASLGPYLLVVPFTGVLADRVKRKPLLFTVDMLQSLFTVGLTIIFMIYYTPNEADPTAIPYKTLLITSAFVTLGLRGVMQAFHEPVVSTLIPNMVPEKHYSRINGLSFLIGGIIRVVGPALGAILLSTLGVSLTMWADILTFAIAVIPLIIIKIPAPKVAEKEKKPNFTTQFVEGFRVLKETRGMVALLFAATFANFFIAPISTLLPLFVSKVHNGTEDHYAIVISLLQAGIIIGGLFMVLFKGFKRKIRITIISVMVLYAGQSVLILVPPTMGVGKFWLLGSILFLSILMNPAGNVSVQTVMQMIIPKDKFGRVSSVLSFMAMAISPIGVFLAGLIGEFVPIPWVFTGSSILGIITILSLYLFTPMRNLDNVLLQKIGEQLEPQTNDDLLLDDLDGEPISAK
jgi:DHA3 family macrolide efflux protein-like MFS transporter